MKKILTLFCAAAILASCGGESVKVSVENPTAFDRVSEIVEIPVADLQAKFVPGSGKVYVVKNAAGDIIPSQITYDGKLIFQAGVTAGETVEYSISEGTPQQYEAKAGGRFEQRRLDDYVWENDKVGFRIYGAALVEKDGPSNGIDAFYKRTDKIVVDKWFDAYFADGTPYHADHGEGMDDYKVGRSLGAGAMAPYKGEKLWLNENFVGNETLDEGPLRHTFKVTYKDFDVDGKNITETRTISLDAGSQLSKVVQFFGTQEAMPVAAGLVKRDHDDYIATSNYVVYSEMEDGIYGDIYFALLLPEGIEYTTIDTYETPIVVGKNKGKMAEYSHILAVAEYTPGTPFTYYTGFGWSKWGFPSKDSFLTYMENFNEALANPLIVKYQ